MRKNDMVVLGFSGRRRDAAAALAVDGKVVAAASEGTLVRVERIGYRDTGGFPFHAAEACLARGGVTAEQIDRLAVVRANGPDRWTRSLRAALAGSASHRALAEHLPAASLTQVSGRLAHAWHVAAASDRDPSLILVIDADPSVGGGWYLKQGGTLAERGVLRGLPELGAAAARLAASLGCEAGNPYDALERLGARTEAAFMEAFDEAVSWASDTGFVVHASRLAELVAVDAAGSLGDPWCLNIHVQQRRRAIAASFSRRLAALVARLATWLCETTGIDSLGVGGTLFSSPDLNSALRATLGTRFYVAPVPETPGCAIGAALAAESSGAAGMASLTLGPDYSEESMKAALDNCRLDYVYEPSWPRLLGRVSALLSRGKVVGWFQGPMEFGPRSLGGRSILCDAGDRYARENVNRFVKQRADDHPLAVSLTEASAEECLTESVCSPYMLLRATVRERWRDRFRAALDADQGFPVHTVTREQSWPMWHLLEIHRAQNRGAGLVNTTLSGVGEPTACTPRDAIRTVFSSAIDVLVMGRFLVMKDYWLLRSDADV